MHVPESSVNSIDDLSLPKLKAGAQTESVTVSKVILPCLPHFQGDTQADTQARTVLPRINGTPCNCHIHSFSLQQREPTHREEGSKEYKYYATTDQTSSKQ